MYLLSPPLAFVTAFRMALFTRCTLNEGTASGRGSTLPSLMSLKASCLASAPYACGPEPTSSTRRGWSLRKSPSLHVCLFGWLFGYVTYVLNFMNHQHPSVLWSCSESFTSSGSLCVFLILLILLCRCKSVFGVAGTRR